MSPLGIEPVTFCLCGGSKRNESPQFQENPGTTTETLKHEDTMRYYPAKKTQTDLCPCYLVSKCYLNRNVNASAQDLKSLKDHECWHSSSPPTSTEILQRPFFWPALPKIPEDFPVLLTEIKNTKTRWGTIQPKKYPDFVHAISFANDT